MVLSIVDENKVQIVIIVKRTAGESNKNDVVSPFVDSNVIGIPSPKMLSSLTKIDDNEIIRFYYLETVKPHCLHRHRFHS